MLLEVQTNPSTNNKEEFECFNQTAAFDALMRASLAFDAHEESAELIYLKADAIDAMRDKPDALFKDGLMSRMVAATKNIKLETSQRVAAEQQFVASLTSYTEALQSGLRMVNKSVAGGSVPPARIVR